MPKCIVRLQGVKSRIRVKLYSDTNNNDNNDNDRPPCLLSPVRATPTQQANEELKEVSVH